MYLINHSLGAMPLAARTRMLEYADTWATRGVRAWGEGWWEMPITVGNKIASIIGAKSGSVTMHQNVSIAQAIILSCFDLPRTRRRKIVYEALNFPSVMHVYDAHAKEAGIEVVRVASDDGRFTRSVFAKECALVSAGDVMKPAFIAVHTGLKPMLPVLKSQMIL